MVPLVLVLTDNGIWQMTGLLVELTCVVRKGRVNSELTYLAESTCVGPTFLLNSASELAMH